MVIIRNVNGDNKMRYQHPRKTPITPMYQWLERRNREREVEEYNIREHSAVHWYRLYKEREKYFEATPMRVFWESVKEMFPEAWFDTGLLPKTLIEVEEENKKLREENEKLKRGY